MGRYDPRVISFPDVTPGEPVAVSATLYTTYAKCPQQALGRLHGEYPPDSIASFRGGLAHRMFARHLGEGPIDPAGFEQAAREEIGRSLNPKIGSLGLKPSDLGGLIREVGELYERFKQVSAEGFRSAEMYLEHEAAPDVTLKGSVDAVFDEETGGVRLVDWKTGGVEGAEDQLGFYVLLWALVYGELPTTVEALSVGTGERFAATPTEDGAQRTARRVANLVSRLREAFGASTDLERRGGRWCRFCPLLSTCDEGRAAVAVFAH
jgi:hypothetical protein